MSAHSQASAVNVAVEQYASPNNWWSWLQHIALAANQLMAWTNQPRLVALTVATLPQEPLPGMIAYVTDSTVSTGTPVGGGTTRCLVWHNGTTWKVFAA